MTRTVNETNIDEILAENLTKGMITVDGVVIDVKVRGEWVSIEFRSAFYQEKVGTKVQVFGKLTQPVTAKVLAAIEAEEEEARRS